MRDSRAGLIAPAARPQGIRALAEVMYPHIEQAAEVCAEEAGRFLIEGFELAPSYPVRLRAALGETEIRACFLGHGSFSAEDLAGYRGPKPQPESDLSPGELRESASWIRRRSRQLRQQCEVLRVPHVDVGRLASRPRWPRPGACFLVVAEAPMALNCGAFRPELRAVLALRILLARWLDDMRQVPAVLGWRMGGRPWLGEGC